MIAGSPVLATREREMLLLRERTLGDAMAAETGTDGPQQRLAAALLASVHRVLYEEAGQRSLAGQPKPEICAVLAGGRPQAFDLLGAGPGPRLPPGLTGIAAAGTGPIPCPTRGLDEATQTERLAVRRTWPAAGRPRGSPRPGSGSLHRRLRVIPGFLHDHDNVTAFARPLQRAALQPDPDRVAQQRDDEVQGRRYAAV